jgi:hypothetical protein
MKDIFEEKRCRVIDRHTSKKYILYRCDRKLLIALLEYHLKIPNFQRNLNQDKIDSIFKESNDNEFWYATHGNIIVGVIKREDDKYDYNILDGQHRIQALKMCKNDFDVNILVIYFDSTINMKNFFKSINQNSNFEAEYQYSDDDYIQEIKIYIKHQLELVCPKAFRKITHSEAASNRYNINEFINLLDNKTIKEFYQSYEKEFDNGKLLFSVIYDHINKEAFELFEKLEDKRLYHNKVDNSVFDYDFILALKNIDWIDNLLDPDEEVIRIEKIREKKAKFTKKMRNAVWNKYIGKDKANGKCYDCKCDINIQHFECGHLISHKNGGTSDIDNLRPFCPQCNRQQGSANAEISKEDDDEKDDDEKVMKEVEKKLNRSDDIYDSVYKNMNNSTKNDIIKPRSKDV